KSQFLPKRFENEIANERSDHRDGKVGAPPPDHRLNVQWFPLFRYSPLTRWDSGTIKCSRNFQSIQCADADVQTRRLVDAQEATSTDSRRVCVANSLGILFRVASHDRGWRQRHENR